jgi:hypothetical protein
MRNIDFSRNDVSAVEGLSLKKQFRLIEMAKKTPVLNRRGLGGLKARLN